MCDEQMNVILDRSRGKQRARKVLNDPPDVSVEIVPHRIRDPPFAVLRREHEVDEDLCERLGHGGGEVAGVVADEVADEVAGAAPSGLMVFSYGNPARWAGLSPWAPLAHISTFAPLARFR